LLEVWQFDVQQHSEGTRRHFQHCPPKLEFYDSFNQVQRCIAYSFNIKSALDFILIPASLVNRAGFLPRKCRPFAGDSILTVSLVSERRHVLISRLTVPFLIAGLFCILCFSHSANAEDALKSPVAENSQQDLYATQPTAMTPAECGRCHPGQFSALRNEGGAHRFDCRDCHQIFHAFNPRLDNFAAIMPQCSLCHDAPHGDKQNDCLNCHTNPHKPRSISAIPRLTASCADCHQEPAFQLQQHPSAHSTQTCQTCHSERHGRIPECAECHAPHYQEQEQGSCLGCHPAHHPLQTNFTADTDAKTCAACHSDVFASWTSTTSLHGTVNCTVCHVEHGNIPQCTECHTPPHDPKMMAKFKSCLGCHLDPHNLPVK